jgi:hypothetical protein
MELLGAWEHDRTHGQNLQADLHGRPWGFGAAAWSCKKHGVDLAHIVRQRAAARRHLGEIGALSPSKRLEVFEVVRQPFFLKLCSVNDTGHKRCRVACGAGSQFARRWGFRSANSRFAARPKTRKASGLGALTTERALPHAPRRSRALRTKPDNQARELLNLGKPRHLNVVLAA